MPFRVAISLVVGALALSLSAGTAASAPLPVPRGLPTLPATIQWVRGQLPRLVVALRGRCDGGDPMPVARPPASGDLTRMRAGRLEPGAAVPMPNACAAPTAASDPARSPVVEAWTAPRP